MPKELHDGCFVLHTVKDALKNELPFQGPILLPLLPSQFQVQQGPGGFHFCQDVRNIDSEGVEPA